MREWCRIFNEGRTNVRDEERSGQRTVINEGLTQKVDITQTRNHVNSSKNLQQRKS